MVKGMNSTTLSIKSADSFEGHESMAETYKYAVLTFILRKLKCFQGLFFIISCSF
jgi:hypothetical protein